MPVLMYLPPRPAEEIQSLYVITDSPSASGYDGQELMRQFESVYRQWSERTQFEAPLGHDNAFRHVPFQTAGTIKVRFQEATPMTPRRINVEDADEE